MESRNSLNPRAVPFLPQTFLEITSQDTANLAQAIASSLSVSRLSPPELITFSGDPLKFVDWKTSFMALIDQKPLPACEKMLYLKNLQEKHARLWRDSFTGILKMPITALWHYCKKDMGILSLFKGLFVTNL